jgi:acyl carrier protein
MPMAQVRLGSPDLLAHRAKWTFLESAFPLTSPATELALAKKGEALMDRTSLRQALLEILEDEKGEKVENLEDAVKLREEVGLDSVDVITMVMAIQTRFHIDLETTELQKIATVGDLLDLMQAKLARAARPAA